MRAALLQIVGVLCLIVVAGSVAPTLGLLVAGVALLVFGTLEELR